MLKLKGAVTPGEGHERRSDEVEILVDPGRFKPRPDGAVLRAGVDMREVELIARLDAESDDHTLIFDRPVDVVRVAHEGRREAVVLRFVDEVARVFLVTVVGEALELEELVFVAGSLFGHVFDADQTYVNGREVGHTGYQYPPRRYSIPAGVLEAGANAIAIRFVTHGGSPHFIPDKPYKLIFDDGTEVALTTEWRVAEGAALPACPQADAGGQNLPSVLYNAMLYPLAPYSLSGVVWYQGESNTGDGFRYGQMLSQLINGWRQLWQSKLKATNLKSETACSPLPFVVVQLANFMEPSSRPQNSGWSQVREAQRLVARQLPQTELAVTIDLGEAVDIHPLRKHEVAQRVARCFDHMLWHPNLPLSPQIVAQRVEADQILLTTDEPLRNGSLQEFEVAAADDVFHPAQAQAQGNVITIQSPVDKPCRVRYAWKNNPDHANVFSTDGLPMSPFQLTLQPGN